jgi:hypothetical protein
VRSGGNASAIDAAAKPTPELPRSLLLRATRVIE